MANTLKLKLQNFSEAIATLKQAVDQKENEFIKDSIIKRFEYSFELCWKTAKIMLSEKFGVDVYSPKECFRELRKNQLISDKDTEIFLQMTDDRNEVIHTYNQKFADELSEKIKKVYFRLLKNILEILKKQI